jgi:hypothetical protein
VAVDEGDHAQAVGGGLEGGDIAVLERAQAEPSRIGAEQAVEQGVGGAEVEHGHGAGLSPDPSGLDDAPVAVPPDADLLEARHV